MRYIYLTRCKSIQLHLYNSTVYISKRNIFLHQPITPVTDEWNWIESQIKYKLLINMNDYFFSKHNLGIKFSMEMSYLNCHWTSSLINCHCSEYVLWLSSFSVNPHSVWKYLHKLLLNDTKPDLSQFHIKVTFEFRLCRAECHSNSMLHLPKISS